MSDGPAQNGLVALALFVVAACGPARGGFHEQALHVHVPGLSGVTTDDEGMLWAIPEETRVLVRIDPGRRRQGLGETLQTFPLEGVPANVETEAITFVSASEGTKRFLLGTETAERRRPHDALLDVVFDGERARVEADESCHYELWGLEGIQNQGIEGICAVAGHVFAAAELTAEHEGRRYAPIGHRDARGRWTGRRLFLTSAEGKISGLTCRAVDGAIELVAIERHFGVMRLLRVVMRDDAIDLEPRVLVDLDAWLSTRDPSPNFEGVTYVGDDFALVIDDQFGRVPQAVADLWWLEHDGTGYHLDAARVRR